MQVPTWLDELEEVLHGFGTSYSTSTGERWIFQVKLGSAGVQIPRRQSLYQCTWFTCMAFNSRLGIICFVYEYG